jgi:hypothetical protein
VSRSASANLSVNAGIEELLDKLERQEHRQPVDITPAPCTTDSD